MKKSILVIAAICFAAVSCEKNQPDNSLDPVFHLPEIVYEGQLINIVEENGRACEFSVDSDYLVFDRTSLSDDKEDRVVGAKLSKINDNDIDEIVIKVTCRSKESDHASVETTILHKWDWKVCDDSDTPVSSFVNGKSYTARIYDCAANEFLNEGSLINSQSDKYGTEQGKFTWKIPYPKEGTLETGNCYASFVCDCKHEAMFMSAVLQDCEKVKAFIVAKE